MEIEKELSELCSLLKMISFKEMFQTHFFYGFFRRTAIFRTHILSTAQKKKQQQICHIDVICLPSFCRFNQYA